VNALNAAVQSGLIPDIPQSNGSAGQNPIYPLGYDPTSSNVCSATYGCRIPGDVWDAPDGVFASAFDDGPTQVTPTLLDFLGSNNRTTTHFMIGNNILWYPSEFQLAINAGHDIGVHTWTHPLMTTKSNLELLGEFGWTMQVIHDSTGGRVPKFWRPPYGDSDVRVRAIATEIFGLITVVWNHDTGDYTQNQTAPIEAAMTSFLALPKHPGVIILEHELTNVTVNGFIEAYPMIDQNGWQFESLAQVIGNGSSYLNAKSTTSGDITPMGILVANNLTLSMTATQTTSTSTSDATSTSAVQTSNGSSSLSASGLSASGLSASSTKTSSASGLRNRLYTQSCCYSALVMATLTAAVSLWL
jgi:peptidoglycan/xylan/chitin deacetylase (PgdA/CDA1 family)